MPETTPSGNYRNVLRLLQDYKVLRMEQIKRFADREGNSAGDVYARAIKANGLALKRRQKGDATETWVIKTEFDQWAPEFQADFLAGKLKDTLAKIYPHLSITNKRQAA